MLQIPFIAANIFPRLGQVCLPSLTHYFIKVFIRCLLKAAFKLHPAGRPAEPLDFLDKNYHIC